MLLHFLVNFCEESVSLLCASVSAHKAFRVVCLLKCRIIYLSYRLLLAATQKEKVNEQGILDEVIRAEVGRDRKWCG